MEYLLALLRWKKAIILFVCGVTVLATIVSFVLPVWYKSGVTLLPPRTQGLLSGLSPFSALLKDFAPTGAAARLGSGSGSVNYLAILKSRRAAEAMIQRFDLVRVYERDDHSIEKTMKELEENTNLEIADDGSIRYEVYDRDSVRAAAMANAMVEILNTIAVDLGTTEARSNRIFLERRLNEARKELADAEVRLKEFQEANGIVVLSEDAKASASAIGELYAKKVRADIELSILRKTTGEDNPMIAQLLLEKNEVERKLATFPALGMGSFRLFRDVLIQQKIQEFLVPMFEQARLEEHKDLPAVVVLDPAVPAERKALPKRVVIVSAAGLSALLVAVFGVFLLVRIDSFRREHPDRFGALRSAWSHPRHT